MIAARAGEGRGRRVAGSRTGSLGRVTGQAKAEEGEGRHQKEGHRVAPGAAKPRKADWASELERAYKSSTAVTAVGGWALQGRLLTMSNAATVALGVLP